ncbi:MAG: hypothetical protein Q9161_007412 [Pseudevernia consocians]
MPQRKPAIKRRMYHGPETEEKLAFMLARQLHLQDAQQQRPFPETHLGRLPGEIRNMIYEHLLVAPPLQSTRCRRDPLIAATNLDIASANAAAVITDSEAASEESPRLASVQHPRSAKVSCLAILQTCRQINRETYHIFYAKNTLHFTNAPDLFAFLIDIGQVRRAELTSLHLEGLVVDQPFWTRELLDNYCLMNNIGPVEREELEADRYLAIHPDMYEVTMLLNGSKNLSRLLFEIRACERLDYFIFLKEFLGREGGVVYLVDGSRWVVRWPCTYEDRGVALNVEAASDESAEKEFAEKWSAYKACYPRRKTEGLFRVVVDIIRGPEEKMGDG